jgi:FdrA protein
MQPVMTAEREARDVEVVRVDVVPSFYQDSVVLMRVAADLEQRPGIRRAALFMGTPANHALLEQVGLATEAGRRARPEDLIVAVRAATAHDAERALAAGREALVARRRASERPGVLRPRTLDSALRVAPDANLAMISVPGAYAGREAAGALARGLHVFLFSDNVPLETEIALKREAVARGLLMMGPDCGTAYLDGVGLGFANVVPRGRIGLVAASGTGLQAVACGIAASGEGASHAIGVGGRDLGAEVGGTMTRFALDALAGDAATEVIVLVTKPPHAAVLPALREALAAIPKPLVVCCLGARADGPGLWVETLGDAARAAVSVANGRTWTPRPASDDALRARAGALGHARGGRVLGLFTGGTLAHEAFLVLDRVLGRVAFDPDDDGAGHAIVDLGGDRFTAGRAHPMIDTRLRTDLIRAALARDARGVLLVDVVLGRGAHPDPAGAVAAALGGRRPGSLAVVAALIGTAGDPQDLTGQRARLEAAGVHVFEDAAEAARFAAMLVAP